MSQNKNITVNEIVKESLSIALIRCMEEKDYKEITVADLCRKAGVCRSSFYRNYSSKEDILLTYIQNEYYKEFRKELRSSEKPDISFFLKKRIHFISKHRDFFISVNRNNLLEFIFGNLGEDLMELLSDNTSSYSPYTASIFSSACSGIIRCWIRRDFKESEDELCKILSHVGSLIN